MANAAFPSSTHNWNELINNTNIHHTTIPVHNTFFWSHNTEVLFKGWPGTNAAMYALAIIFVFSLALLVECLIHTNFIRSGDSKVSAGMFRTALYAVRKGIGYMVMLAVMSFNGGVLLAAVGGHAVGFLIFGSGVCGGSDKKLYDDM